MGVSCILSDQFHPCPETWRLGWVPCLSLDHWPGPWEWGTVTCPAQRGAQPGPISCGWRRSLKENGSLYWSYKVSEASMMCAGWRVKEHYRRDSSITGFDGWLNNHDETETRIWGEAGQKLDYKFSKAYMLLKWVKIDMPQTFFFFETDSYMLLRLSLNFWTQGIFLPQVPE